MTTMVMLIMAMMVMMAMMMARAPPQKSDRSRAQPHRWSLRAEEAPRLERERLLRNPTAHERSHIEGACAPKRH